MDKFDNRILKETRWLAALVIPFLVAAFVILFIFPLKTEALFAWKIQPTMSAMMLGAAYAGGIYFFSGVLRSKQWYKVKVGFLPVITFASLLGIATINHWDKFNHTHISFYTWTLLYFTTPFLVFIVWLRNKYQDSRQTVSMEKTIPQLLRLVMGVFGLVTFVLALGLFFQPNLMINLWPWTLTPLTSRVMGAMFTLPGLVGIGVALDQRWHAASLILQSQGFSILLILMAALRARSEFNWVEPSSWLFVSGLGVMLVSIVVLIAVMEHPSGPSKK